MITYCSGACLCTVLYCECSLKRAQSTEKVGRCGGAQSSDGYWGTEAGEVGVESHRNRRRELGRINMLSCFLHLSGAPRGLLMPLSAMQY